MINPIARRRGRRKRFSSVILHAGYAACGKAACRARRKIDGARSVDRRHCARRRVRRRYSYAIGRSTTLIRSEDPDLTPRGIVVCCCMCEIIASPLHRHLRTREHAHLSSQIPSRCASRRQGGIFQTPRRDLRGSRFLWR